MASITKPPQKGVSGLSGISRNNWNFSINWKLPKDVTKSSNKARWEHILVRVTADGKVQASGGNTKTSKVKTTYTTKNKPKPKTIKNEKLKVKKKGGKYKITEPKHKTNTINSANIKKLEQKTFTLGSSATSFTMQNTSNSAGNMQRKYFNGGLVKAYKNHKAINPEWNNRRTLDALIFEVQPWNSKLSKKIKWNSKGRTASKDFKFYIPEDADPPSVTCDGRTKNHTLRYSFRFKNDSSTHNEVGSMTYFAEMLVGLWSATEGKIVAHTIENHTTDFKYVSTGNGTKEVLEEIDPNVELRNLRTSPEKFSVLDMQKDEYIYCSAQAKLFGAAGDRELTNTKAKKEQASYLLAYPYGTKIIKDGVDISDPDLYRVHFELLPVRKDGKRKSNTYTLQMLRNFRPDDSDDWEDAEWDEAAKAAQDNDWSDLSTVGDNEFAFSVNKQNAKPQRFSRTYFRIKASNDDFTPMYSDPVVNPDFVRVPSAALEKVKFLEALSTDDGKSIKITYGWHVTISEQDGVNLASSDGTELTWSTDQYAWRSNNKPESLDMPDEDFIENSLTEMPWSVFSGNAIPTLENEPASNWTDANDKDDNVGAIYYLFNETLPEHGNYYKFSKTENEPYEYSWATVEESSLNLGERPLWAGDISQGKKALRFDLDGKDEKANLVDKIGVVYIRGLSEGTPYYLKLRRYLDKGREERSWAKEYAVYTGDTLAPGEEPVAISPFTKPENLTLSAPDAIAVGDNFSVSWTFESTGEQSKWALYYGKNGITVPQKPSQHVANSEYEEGSWSTSVPLYTEKFNYFYSYEYSNSPGAYEWTDPVEDKAMLSIQSKSSESIISFTKIWMAKSDALYPDKPESHVVSVSTEGDQWTTVMPAYSEETSNYFYCYEYKNSEDEYTWSDPYLDEAMANLVSSGASSISCVWTLSKTIDPVIEPVNEKDPTMLAIPNPLTKMDLTVDSPPKFYEGTDQKGYAVIDYDDVENLLIDDVLYLVVKVWTTGEPATSNVKQIRFSPKPNLRISQVPSILDDQPLRMTLLSDNLNLTLKISVTAEGASIWMPDGLKDQLDGEVVYSNYVDGVDWDSLEEPIKIYGETPPDGSDPEVLATMLYQYTYEFPKMDLLDLGRYEINVTGTDKETDLNTDYLQGGTALEPATAHFTVNWKDKAYPPSKWSYITKTKGKLGVDIHVKASPENKETDVCDIYRVTPDGAYLVKQGQAFNTTITDLYAPFSSTAFTRYRLCTRTSNGDVEFIDIGYRLKNTSIRFDWGDSQDNPPEGIPTYLELPYNISLDDSYEKNFETRLHMDGLYQGYWNKGAKRKVSLSTDIIKASDYKLKEAIKALGRYAGPVYVRTPDGSAYAANVTLDTFPNDYDQLTMSIKLTAEEIALPILYMIADPGNGNGVESMTPQNSVENG